MDTFQGWATTFTSAQFQESTPYDTLKPQVQERGLFSRANQSGLTPKGIGTEAARMIPSVYPKSAPLEATTGLVLVPGGSGASASAIGRAK
ncbi:hypothetical protein PM082_014405 [Marasmius tenuissimus]|nr:hypothetical protein PM082_014405 [Marasmius tenuissimus]